MNKYNVSLDIEKKIMSLRNIELVLGNLPRDKFTLSELFSKDEEFSQQKMEDLTSHAESLFLVICKSFSKEGYNASKTCKIINTYFETDGFLKYCDENDVKDALLAK